jgi:hypothetical protein
MRISSQKLPGGNTEILLILEEKDSLFDWHSAWEKFPKVIGELGFGNLAFGQVADWAVFSAEEFPQCTVEDRGVIWLLVKGEKDG